MIASGRARMLKEIESKKYIECPMCEGIGYVQKGKFDLYAGERLSLPPIYSENENSELIAKPNIDHSQSHSGAAGGIHLPTLRDRHNSKNNFTITTGDYIKMLEQNFLGVPETFKNPQEALKVALQNVKENNWRSSTPALINLMQISRFHPDLLDCSMPMINRSLCSLLNNSRPQIVRTACQVAMELYKTIGYSQRPEFDELVATLLLKSGHTKKGIREDAKRALDSMVLNLPASISTKVLASEHGAGHKNPHIRATVSCLVSTIVDMTGVDALLSNRNLKDVRRKIFVMCSKFLVDGNSETRSNAKKILKSMLNHCDFDTLFYQDVDRKTVENIKKQLVSLKYG